MHLQVAIQDKVQAHDSLHSGKPKTMVTDLVETVQKIEANAKRW